MAQPQKETILGNYTSFPRFPLDCESMEYIQENIKHLAIIAQIAGCDKLIIKGCTGNSQSRAEGYVYVRTGDDLVGEILYSPAGSGVRCGISTENINATANNETFTSAYTIRKLVSGTTGEWSWSDFRALSEITNSALKTLVDGKAAANHTHAISNITGLQAALDGKAAASHTHPIGNITGLQAALDGKAASSHTHNYSAPGHGHSISDVSGLQSALDGKAAASHTHNYSAPGHTHDDRYYTKSDWAVSSGDTEYDSNTQKYRVHWRQQGKVVTLWLASVKLNSGVYSSKYLSVPKPAVNVSGVGFAYLASYNMDTYTNDKNLMPFTLDSDGYLKVANHGGYTTMDATITYICK